jgi:Ser/Thr protein kinase RdoA (MazF antagonist)
MSPPLSVSTVQRVLAHYPLFCRQGTLTPLGNCGGFSGADLWRIDTLAGALCLRAWPSQETWPRLLFRHRLMTQARQHGLRFVPAVFTTLDGTTGVEHAGRLWELIEWLSGNADFHQRPSSARLEAACTALAQLHIIWRNTPEEMSRCPAIQRRLEFVEQWRRLMRSGWQPLAEADYADPLIPLVESAWQTLPAAMEQVPRRLQRWVNTAWRLQPCLCDLWHDHLLFEDDRLTGLIDYGAVKIDQVAVDLARMLGSLVREDAKAWQRGLQEYRRFAPLTSEEEELAHVLDETGTILGLANWLRWLYEEKRPFADRFDIARRLAELVERLQTRGERPVSAGWL